MPLDTTTFHLNRRCPSCVHDWGLLKWLVEGFLDTQFTEGHFTCVICQGYHILHEVGDGGFPRSKLVEVVGQVAINVFCTLLYYWGDWDNDLDSLMVV